MQRPDLARFHGSLFVVSAIAAHQRRWYDRDVAKRHECGDKVSSLTPLGWAVRCFAYRGGSSAEGGQLARARTLRTACRSRRRTRTNCRTRTLGRANLRFRNSWSTLES